MFDKSLGLSVTLLMSLIAQLDNKIEKIENREPREL